jgi:chemotaxis protein MotA
VLAGLARTADFRWWGDRVSLTVSIGAAQADPRDPAAACSKRADRHAVQHSRGRKPDHIGIAGGCMFAIIGIVVVFGAVIGGFLMEKGHIMVLVQPAELLILGGAAIGTLLVANPIHIIKGIVAGLMGVLKGSPIRQEALSQHPQDDVPVPEQGAQRRPAQRRERRREAQRKLHLQKLSRVPQRPSRRDFVCDTLRTAITGGVEPFDMDQMMELDMEVHHHEATQPVNAS